MSLYVDIQKSFGEFQLDIKFETGSGTTGLLGASGCGKTMTLRCIAGVEKPDKGRIELNGKVLFNSEQKVNLPPQKRRTGYLFQNYALFPNMTVRQNISIGLGGTKAERENLVTNQIEAFFLQGLQDRYPHQLSGGQQQRVALARIMVRDPDILMFDEPFSALDSSLKWRVEQELTEALEQYHGTTLFVSHSRDEVYRICSNMAIISDGKLDCCGRKDDIFSKPPTLSAAQLTGCKNFSKIKKVSKTVVDAVEWGVRFDVEEKVAENINYIGIRAHYFALAEEYTPNAIPCQVLKTIDSPFTVSVLFMPRGHQLASPICWEVEKPYWQKIKDKVRYVSVLPKDILLLEHNG